MEIKMFIYYKKNICTFGTSTKNHSHSVPFACLLEFQAKASTVPVPVLYWYCTGE